jgi:hypothetical protein
MHLHDRREDLGDQVRFLLRLDKNDGGFLFHGFSCLVGVNW